MDATNFYSHIRKKRRSSSLRKVKIAVLLLFFLSSLGCSGLILDNGPTTLGEIIKYIQGDEQSFAYPLSQVVIASVASLNNLNFTLSRIELAGDRDLIHADWNETRVIMRFDEVTPKLTRLRIKMSSKEGYRRFSSEKELFNHIRDFLEQGTKPDLRTLTAKMTPVYLEPDSKSRVIAYIAPGVEVAVVENKHEWTGISLVSGGTGYMWTRYVTPKRDKKEPSDK